MSSVNFNFGSDYDFYNRLEKNTVGFSKFNLSFINTTTLFDTYIVPVALYDALPGDDFDLSIDFLLKSVPLKVPVMSSYKIFFHAFYQSYYSMWRLFKNFVTRGRSGTYEAVPPFLQFTDLTELKKATSQIGLWSYLGLPQLYSAAGSDLYNQQSLSFTKCDYHSLTDANAISSISAAQISAFPFFMYQRIKRDYFTLSPDAVIKSDGQEALYPDDDDQIQLSAGANSWINLGAKNDSDLRTDTELWILRKRDWRGDYFTSSMPSEQRGTPPTLSTSFGAFLASTTIDIPKMQVFNNIVNDDGFTVPVFDPNVYLDSFKPNESTDPLYPVPNYDIHNPDNVYRFSKDSNSDILTQNVVAPYNMNFYNSPILNGKFVTLDKPFTGGVSSSQTLNISPSSKVTTSISMSDLRALSAFNLWQERNGRTNGDYNSEIMAHFGVYPNIDDHKAKLIGSFFENIYFSEVVQQSESTESSPLGDTAGRGITTSSGRIGRFRCNDFGLVMVVCSILPDVGYAQGIEKLWFKHTFADYYYPEWANFGPQGVLNKEIFATFDNAGTGEVSTGDNNLLSWQNRFDEYRFHKNIATGAIGNYNLIDWHTWTNIRWFSDTPQFSKQFMQANTSHDAFTTGTADFPFILQVANKTWVNRPLPYYAEPSSMGIK